MRGADNMEITDERVRKVNKEGKKKAGVLLMVVGIALMIQVRWLLLLVVPFKSRQIVSPEAFMRL